MSRSSRRMWPTPTGAPHRPTVGGCNLLATVALELLRNGADVLSTRGFPNSASIVIFYRGKVVGGELRAGDDADRVEWFGPDELPEIAFESTKRVLARWKKKQTL